MRRLWLLATPLLGACNTHGDGAEKPLAPPAAVEPKVEPVATAKPSGTPWAEPEVTHLLAVAHDNTAGQARVLPLALAEEGLTSGKERSWTAHPMSNWAGHFSFVLSHGGAKGYASVQPAGNGFQVVWAVADDPATDLATGVGKVAPAALMVVDHTVLVGIDNTLGQVDFAEPDRAYVRLHERPEMKFKAYDLFARAGDWVIAIDDEVTPVYADGLRLDGQGHARHVVGFEMPNAINGSYRHAVLHATGPGAGTLYAIIPYGILSGNGQNLARLPVAAGKTTFGGELTLNSTTHPNVLEEHAERGSGRPIKLAAGTAMTPWTGLALLEEGAKIEAVLAAAGARGLFAFAPETGPDSKASVVNLGADCHDVKVVGSRVFALVEGAVVELKHEGDGLIEVGRTPISSGFRRWAR